MRLGDLSPEAIEKVKRYHLDHIVEKHEGWGWDTQIDYVAQELWRVDGRDVLLPLHEEHVPNLTVVRCVASDDDTLLTIFLRDTTYGTGFWQDAFMAVCARVPGEDFYVAFMYHECSFHDSVVRGELPPERGRS